MKTIVCSVVVTDLLLLYVIVLLDTSKLEELTVINAPLFAAVVQAQIVIVWLVKVTDWLIINVIALLVIMKMDYR